MSTHNIPFSSIKNHPKLSQICSYGIFSKGLKNEFETAVVNESSVFEPLKFYCIFCFGRVRLCLSFTYIQKGDLGHVKQLIEGLKEKGDINRYTDVLFQCVDTGRQNIAVYLIRSGMRTDIYKQVR